MSYFLSERNSRTDALVLVDSSMAEGDLLQKSAATFRLADGRNEFEGTIYSHKHLVQICVSDPFAFAFLRVEIS